jgi:hypothetical protein
VVALRAGDVALGGYVADRATVREKKIDRPDRQVKELLGGKTIVKKIAVPRQLANFVVRDSLSPVYRRASANIGVDTER